MGRMWHYAQNGQPQSPVSEEQLKAMLAGGSLRPSDLVWRDGMASWTPAGQVAELAPAPAPYHAPLPPPPAAPSFAPPSAPSYTPPSAPSYSPPAAPSFAPPAAPSFTPPAAPAFAAPSYAAPARAYQAPAPYQPFPAPTPEAPGTISPGTVEMLRKTKPWVRLLGVLGAIGMVFVILAALFVAVGVTPPFSQMPIGPRLLAAGMYLVMSLLYLPPVIFLNRYASRIAAMVNSGEVTDLEAALKAQKSFWKYVGILTLIAILLSVIAIPVAILLPMILAR